MTETQRRIWQFVKDFTATNKTSPNYREIADHMKMTVGAIQHHVPLMKERGWLMHTDGRPNSFVALDVEEKA